ncbi:MULTISPECIES: outer membrane beta-barrel protein [unclassified Bradyrhizobium]|uniref:outer membrane protein n=1 Tax=unclassified Bradyrhizobium TaxID=2631580 RepID=UPI001FF7C517|nr:MULTISPECIES: outer membrane beta-barrel protein [unclassified Bradyrhizobium]MCK1524323.1 porin family protein [Bradyrhizobium sp. 17]MCK1604078.1 porin family protein [Bradyrhizobium sp. 166]MCK1689393.1 porin family protein [Bradyrhizobium sp. 145]
MKRIVMGMAAAMTLFATGAVAADLAARPYVKAPVMVDPGYNWSGFYVGGNVGYSWGRERDDGTLTGVSSAQVFRTAGPTPVGAPVVTVLGAVPVWGRSNVDGVIGGGQFGYNWQQSNWLVGLEADLQASDEKSTGTICVAVGCPAGSALFPANYKLDWFGTVRGRVGWLASPRILLYATGGLAYGHLDASAPAVGIGWGGTNAGWTVGAGGEFAIDRSWSVKVEYLYMDLGSFNGASASATTVTNALNTPGVGFNTVTTTTTTANFGTRFTDNIVRVGVNYRFSGPVVAKY